jgi:hypothetical protein
MFQDCIGSLQPSPKLRVKAFTDPHGNLLKVSRALRIDKANDDI